MPGTGEALGATDGDGVGASDASTLGGALGLWVGAAPLLGDTTAPGVEAQATTTTARPSDPSRCTTGPVDGVRPR
jgi:hypothetical protein